MSFREKVRSWYEWVKDQLLGEAWSVFWGWLWSWRSVKTAALMLLPSLTAAAVTREVVTRPPEPEPCNCITVEQIRDLMVAPDMPTCMELTGAPKCIFVQRLGE